MLDKRKLNAMNIIKEQMYREIDMILQKTEQRLLDIQKDEKDWLEERYCPEQEFYY